MINTSVNKKEHTVQSGVVDYPIGFPFYFNPDRTPQLLVKIGDEELRYNHNFELSEDKGSVVLRPTEEESWTLEGPEDLSWMAKWDGKDLLIERAVPFVQDSDYQLGRISSEQIERDFDLSVMRDQILAGQIKEHADDVQGEIDALHSRIDSVQEEHSTDMAEVDKVMATKAVKADVDAEFTTVKNDLATKATKTELKNAKSDLSEDIQSNANAILRIRNDYEAADQNIRADMNKKDSELERMITERAEDLTTLRADVNKADRELQTLIATKQDQLTAGDNIVISNNIISATGAGGGAGLDMVVVDQLPETGEKGTLYLVKKDGAAPDIHDEYVWIAATHTFELIGTTQVDLSGYAKKTYVDSADQTLRNNQESLYRNQIELRDQLNTKDADGNWTTLTTTAQAAIPAINELNEKIESAGGGTDLPDMTDNAGKFLTNDGETASWADVPAGGTKVIIKRYS